MKTLHNPHHRLDLSDMERELPLLLFAVMLLGTVTAAILAYLQTLN